MPLSKHLKLKVVTILKATEDAKNLNFLCIASEIGTMHMCSPLSFVTHADACNHPSGQETEPPHRHKDLPGAIPSPTLTILFHHP